MQCPLSGLLLFFQSSLPMSYSGLAAGVRPRKELEFYKDLGDSSEAYKLLHVNVVVYFFLSYAERTLRAAFSRLGLWVNWYRDCWYRDTAAI